MRRLPALAAAVLVLFPTSSASAKDICVPPLHAECAGDMQVTTFREAVVEANDSPGADRVLLGAGTYPDDQTVGADAAQDLDVDGSGRDATFLDVAGTGEPLVTINNPDSVVSDLEIRMVGAGSVIGLVLNSGLLERVDVGGTANESSRGVVMAAGADLTSVRIDLSVAQNAFGVYLGPEVAGSGTSTFTDVATRGRFGLYIAVSSPIVVRRGHYQGSNAGILIFAPTYDFDADSFIARGVVQNGQALNFQASSPGTSTAVIRHATLYNHTGDNSAAEFSQFNGGTTSVGLESSVIGGPTPDILAWAHNPGSTSTVDPDYSSFNPTQVAEREGDSGVATIASGDGNLPGPGARFVDATNGDFRIYGDSPFVDTGEPMDVIAGASQFDVLGGLRVLDGNDDGDPRRDIGAEEFDPDNPPPAPPTT
ncbi:MAG: hypothetical protein M3320_05920, partial [Actinomycetota bacterium]|nr:hypothetical protein [Actinomycetota bacterium]